VSRLKQVPFVFTPPPHYKLRIDTLNRKLLENQWEKV
jgi:hypothetical protein